MSPRAVIALTSYNGVFGADGYKTGVHFTEALQPYIALRQAGYEVQYVSENGEYYWDDTSLIPSETFDERDQKYYNDKDNEFHKLLAGTKPASEVSASDYKIFYAAGGHGTLFDFPKAKNLQKLAADIYSNGGVIAAVCHGPAILENLISNETGEPLVKGKKYTAFTPQGETECQADVQMAKFGVENMVVGIEKFGGSYVQPPHPWKDFVVVDERLVTGVNPQSATSVAERAIELAK